MSGNLLNKSCRLGCLPFGNPTFNQPGPNWGLYLTRRSRSLGIRGHVECLIFLYFVVILEGIDQMNVGLSLFFSASFLLSVSAFSAETGENMDDGKIDEKKANSILAELIKKQQFYGLPLECIDLKNTDNKNSGYTIDVYTKKCSKVKQTTLLGKWRIDSIDQSAYVQNRHGKYKSPLITQRSMKITEDQAKEIIDSIPEVRTWADHIMKSSKGLCSLILITSSDKGCCYKYNDNDYWEITAMERTPADAMDHAWQFFLVRDDGSEVLISDPTVDENEGILSISEWRNQGRALRSLGYGLETP